MGYVSLTEPGSDGVATLAIDRPPANALDLELLEQIVAAVRDLAPDPPRALVLTGREGFFSAGADLKMVPIYGRVRTGRLLADETRPARRDDRAADRTGGGGPAACPVGRLSGVSGSGAQRAARCRVRCSGAR
jgi:enoyl-CoA hydratase